MATSTNRLHLRGDETPVDYSWGLAASEAAAEWLRQVDAKASAIYNAIVDEARTAGAEWPEPPQEYVARPNAAGYVYKWQRALSATLAARRSGCAVNEQPALRVNGQVVRLVDRLELIQETEAWRFEMRAIVS